MAELVRLTTRQQRTERAAAAELAEQLRHMPDELLQQLPGGIRLAISRATHGLHRHARPDTTEGIWPGGFTMLSRLQTKAIWKAIRALPAEKRQHQVRAAFDAVLLNLRQDTGEVMLRRDELADEIGTEPDNVSRVMGVLVEMGVITRRRQRVEGMRGPGVVIYSVNPHVAWNGSLDVRKQEAEGQSPPLLKLMKGGKPVRSDDE